MVRDVQSDHPRAGPTCEHKVCCIGIPKHLHLTPTPSSHVSFLSAPTRVLVSQQISPIHIGGRFLAFYSVPKCGQSSVIKLKVVSNPALSDLRSEPHSLICGSASYVCLRCWVHVSVAEKSASQDEQFPNFLRKCWVQLYCLHHHQSELSSSSSSSSSSP